jgi:hypothetical protein
MEHGRLAAGRPVPVRLSLAAGVFAEVSARDYCGPACAKPVTLAFALPGRGGGVAAIPRSPTDASGVPPCDGKPGSPGHLSIRAWHT